MLQIYTVYLYTHRSEEAKRKQSEQRRLQRKRSQKILDENAMYGPPDKATILTMKSLQVKRKENISLQKLPLQSKQQNRPEKHLLLVPQ